MTARTSTPKTTRKTPKPVEVTVSVRLTVAEAKALAEGVFTCTSTSGWREAERALDRVRAAAAEQTRGRT